MLLHSEACLDQVAWVFLEVWVVLDQLVDVEVLV